MGQNHTEIIEYIKRRLGAPTLGVELDPLQLEDCIGNAMVWFSAKKGLIFRTTLYSIKDQSEYILPDYVEEVIWVYFMAKDWLLRDDFGFALYGIPYFGGMFMGATPRVRGQLFSYSSLVQWLQYIEMGKRVLGVDRGWEFNRMTRTLYLLPKPSQSELIYYDYKGVIGQEHIPDLPIRDYDLLRRYALAEAKEILGRIRSKYASIPAAGGEINLDGSTLLDEAKAEKERLEEEIGETALPMPFITG